MIIGLFCGFILPKEKPIYHKMATITISCLLGVFLAKTLVECSLYNIPFAVKASKNIVVFSADAITMFIGLILYNTTLKKIIKLN